MALDGRAVSRGRAERLDHVAAAERRPVAREPLGAGERGEQLVPVGLSRPSRPCLQMRSIRHS